MGYLQEKEKTGDGPERVRGRWVGLQKKDDGDIMMWEEEGELLANFILGLMKPYSPAGPKEMTRKWVPRRGRRKHWGVVTMGEEAGTIIHDHQDKAGGGKTPE